MAAMCTSSAVVCRLGASAGVSQRQQRATRRSHHSHRHFFFNVAKKQRQRSGGGARSLTVRAGELNTEKDYNCVVNQEGVIIANDIPSGVYEVSAWWAGANKDGEEPLAPRCDSEKQRGCEVRCEMTAEGELVCEGLSSGTYRVINAEEADASCDVDASGDAFECTVSWSEDDQGPIVVDTGGINLKETAEDRSFRMGG